MANGTFTFSLFILIFLIFTITMQYDVPPTKGLMDGNSGTVLWYKASHWHILCPCLPYYPALKLENTGTIVDTLPTASSEAAF